MKVVKHFNNNMNIEEINPDENKKVLIYTKTDTCTLCKGYCCKTAAGIYAPEDFKISITTAFILHLLCTKMFSIESIGEGKDVLYFFRPRHVDENQINPHIYGGLCVNWDAEIGCSLSEEDRPYQCRTLIPLYDGSICSHKNSDKARKSDMVERWIPYQNELKQAIYYYEYVSNAMEYKPYEQGIRVNIYLGIHEKINLINKLINHETESEKTEG